MDGSVSADGSPVEAYAALPAEPELSVVRGLLAGRQRILDLGCGTGRIADPLAADGLDVLAVDESPAMLGRVQRAKTLCSPIEELDLGQRFDAVLLLSHLVNAANAAALLDAAARHLADDGLLIAQRLEPGRDLQPGSSQVGPVTISLDDVVVAEGRIDAATGYTVGGRTWVQRWTLWERDDEQIETLLAAAGLHAHTMDGAWITASR